MNSADRRRRARARLGVGPQATTAEVTRAYHRLARRTHPDVSSAADASDSFVALTQAYRDALDAAAVPAPSAPATAGPLPTPGRSWHFAGRADLVVGPPQFHPWPSHEGEGPTSWT